MDKNVKIDFVYNKAWPHTKEGLAYVQKEGKCGFIDQKGQERIPLIYLDAASFSEGLAMVKKGEKDFAFIDRKGQEVISGLSGIVTPQFKNGEAIVIKGERQMTIDQKGNCLEGCPGETQKGITGKQQDKQKARVEALVKEGEYQRAVMKLKELQKMASTEKQKSAIDNRIDQLERKITATETARYQKLLEEAQPYFHKGDFAAAIKIYRQAMQSNLIFMPEAKEKLALSEKYLAMEKNQSNALYGFQHPNGKWGIKNARQEVVLAPFLDSVGVLSNGFIAVQEDGLWGFLDKKGEMAIKPFYDQVQPFSNEGFARVNKNGRSFTINRYGRRAEVLGE